MDVQKQRSRLLKQIAYLPGSRDRVGGPILVIDAVCNSGAQSGAHERVSGSRAELSENVLAYEDIVSLVGYLAQIPDEYSRRLGFTVLIDGRRAHLKHLRNALRACQHALYRQIKQVIIVQPERFLEQQKLNFDLIKEAYEFKTTVTCVHKLSKYIDVTQLPESLGGTFSYDVQKWIHLRERYENFVVKASSWIQTARRHEKAALSESAVSTDPHKTIVAPEALLKQGGELLDELMPADATSFSSRNSDCNSAAQKVESLLKQIKNVEEAPALEAKRAHQRASYKASMKLIDDHAQGIRSLVEWIFGAGEKWLLTLHEVGESIDDAKQLVKDHVQLEAKSKEVSDQADELCEMANRLIAEFPSHAITLEKSKQQLHNVADTFCSRVERQKRIAMQSVSFHQMLAEFSHRTDALLESLCTEVKAINVASVEKEGNDMESKVDEMEKIYHALMDSGVAFIDELCVDESNSSGRAVTRDYSTGIVHVRERLEETRERRRRCQDLVDLRRLKVQQLLQLYTCEKDGEQAVKWIDELHETLVNEYDDVDESAEAARTLREDRLKLEETARSTYEYGKQLCQVALVLRRSLRMDVQPQLSLNQRLEAAWGAICRALSDNEAKLNISDAFHATVKEVSSRLDELCLKVNEHLMEGRVNQNYKKHSLNSLNTERKSLASDTRELKHIADMLVAHTDNKCDRNAKPRAHCNRRNAADEVRCKLAQVEEKQRKLENLWLNSICSAPLSAVSLPREKNNNSAAIAEGSNSLKNRHIKTATNTVHFDSVSPNVSPDSAAAESVAESPKYQQRLQS
ncbi:SEC14 domain and spectrin repeat-containing protein 1 [Toxocara canis]|uniref:SEC14 domain and spectrin repeat-containing protein 1 n=1 Tax=Toxocara canis TaxID=6265 RepID=A0A0B2VU17_TOXCA|nr:SEC14 domain and spectrin repeat-containing protein 1 [Toxocara canis]